MLLLAGAGCVFVSIIGLLLAWQVYDVMSTFPVPGPEPVEPDIGPGVADIAVFGGIGLLGVAGLLMMLLSTPWRESSAGGGPAAE